MKSYLCKRLIVSDLALSYWGAGFYLFTQGGKFQLSPPFFLVFSCASCTQTSPFHSAAVSRSVLKAGRVIYRESVNLRQTHPNEHGCVNEQLIFFSLFYFKLCVHLYAFGHSPLYQNYSGFLWVVSLISEQFLSLLWLTANTDCMMQMICRNWCIQNTWCFNNTDSYNKVNFV